MKKIIALLLLVFTVIGLCGCEKYSENCSLEFTIPKGSNNIVYAEPLLALNKGDIKIHAEYETGGVELLAIWFANTYLEQSGIGNPYTNQVIMPGEDAELSFDGDGLYRVGVQLDFPAERDVEVKITIYYN